MSESADVTEVDIIKEWLKAKGCTLWSDWTIDDESGLSEAAEWMHKQLTEMMDFVESRYGV